MLVIVTLLFIVNKLIYSYQSISSFSGFVIDIEEKEYSTRYLVRRLFTKVYVDSTNKSDIKIGDFIKVNGTLAYVDGIHNEYEFNYNNYLEAKHIISIIKVNDLSQIEKNSFINPLYIKRYIYEYIDISFNKKSKSYILSLIFANSTLLEENIKDAISINGISHLFAISGLHVTLIITFLEKYLERFKKKDKIIISILIGYMFLTSFCVSVARSVIMYILKVVNEKKRLHLSKIDQFTIVFIFFIIINPLVIYSISFILSFLASFVLITTTNLLEKIKIFKIDKLNNILKSMVTIVILQIMSLPIICNMNSGISLLTILTNIIFIPFVTKILLPFTFICFFLPFFDVIYTQVINIFEKMNLSITNINIVLQVPSFAMIEALIYYFIIIIFLFNRKKKYIYFYIIFLLLFVNKTKINLIGKMSFLDLNQGESTVIDLPFNNGIIVIDTGDGARNEVTNYLKASGVRKINYLIITHSDKDHNGEVKKIINNFVVENVIKSIYDDEIYTEKDIKVKNGDIIKCKNVSFEVISPKERSDNTNDNSIVLYVKIGNKGYLFTGDASSKIEETLEIKEKIDVIKIAHHGSKSSTSEEFIRKIKPTYAIIMAGRRKVYNFPSKEVIKRLKNVKVYRTDVNNQINIYFSNHFFRISGIN